jgi:hypothetical protein
MIQAVHAIGASVEKLNTQGAMNNQTPRMTEITSTVVAAVSNPSAINARITPIIPTIHASHALDPCVKVLKTQGETNRRTPNTRETQSCQRVHAFMIYSLLAPASGRGPSKKHVGGLYLGRR